MSTIPGEEIAAAHVGVYVDRSGLKSGMAAAKSEAMSGADSISAGLRTSLSKGDYKGVGKKLGADLVSGMSSSFGSLGGAAGSLATALGPVGVAALAATVGVAALGKGIASAVSTAADFQQSMANVASVAGGGAEAMQALSDAAREAGAGTVFSASQAAEAEYYLASAGMQTNEIVSSLGDTLLLAGAGNLELGRSAEIVTGTLAQYQMTADETGRVVNVLAAAASGSNTTINQLGVGMAKVGALANAANISFESTSAALMVLADANIKGEEGGTALRGVIASLADITPKGAEALEEMGLTADDVNPAMHSLDEIFQTLNEHGLTMADAIKLFGREAASAGTVLAQSAGDIKSYEESITGTSKAQDMYNTQTDTFQASMKMLGSAIEEAKISLGNVFLPVLTDVAGGMAEGVTAITGFGQSLYGIGQGVNSALEPLGGLVGVIEQITLLGPALDVAGSATGFVGDLASDLSSIATGDINIGGEWFGSAEDLKAARAAGKITGDEYINGAREVIQSKSDVSGIDTSRMMHDIQGLAEAGRLDVDTEYIDTMESVADIYEEIGDAAYEMADPLVEAFDEGTISAEDMIAILEDMASATQDLGDDAEDIIQPFVDAWDGSKEGAVLLQEQIDIVAKATASLGDDAESMLSPISDALKENKLSAEEAASAIQSMATIAEQYGPEAADALMGPLNDALSSGDIVGGQYESMAASVAEAAEIFGPEMAKLMADLNAEWESGGFENIDAYNLAVTEGIDGLGEKFPEKVEKALEGVDAEGAGETVGDKFNKGLQEALRTGKPQTETELQYLNSFRAVGYDEDAAEKGSAAFTSGGVEYTYQWDESGQRYEYSLYADGKKIATLANVDMRMGPDDLFDVAGIDSPVPGSADWYDMLGASLSRRSEQRGLMKSDMASEGAYAMAFKLRLEPEVELVEVELVSPYDTRDTTQNMAEFWAENVDIVEAGGDELLLKLYNLESRLQSEGAAGWEAAWANIFDPDATDQQVSAAIAALDLSESEVALVENLRVTLGDIDAAEVFEDLFSEEIPISFSSMISAGLTDFDELFEDVGKQAISAFNGGLSEEEAFSIAGMYAEMQDTDAAMFAEMGGEDSLAWWTEAARLIHERNLVASVGGDTSLLDDQLDEFFGTYKGVVDVTTNLTTPSISAFREAQLWAGWGGSDAKRGLGEYADDLMALKYEIEDATEYQSDLDAAFEMMIDPLSYTNEELAEARNILIQYTDATEDQIDATMRYYASIGDVTAATKALKNEVTETGMPDWMSHFSYFQEDLSNKMFLKSYIGETEGWAGPGLGAKAGYEASNYFQYGVEVDLELDPTEANAELETLESDIAAEKIAPIDADIAPALTELERLEAEIMAPVTKPVYLEVIDSSQGIVQGGAFAEGVEPWLSFAEGGIVSSPIAAIVGDAPTPEVIAPLGDLTRIVQQAVATVGGGDTFQLIVQGNITEDVWPTVRAEMQEMIDKSESKTSRYIKRAMQ